MVSIATVSSLTVSILTVSSLTVSILTVSLVTVSLVMVGEGPPSTSRGPGFTKTWMPPCVGITRSHCPGSTFRTGSLIPSGMSEPIAH
jgi:hypothetical protein